MEVNSDLMAVQAVLHNNEADESRARRNIERQCAAMPRACEKRTTLTSERRSEREKERERERERDKQT